MPSVATTTIMTTGVTARIAGVVRVTRAATMTHALGDSTMIAVFTASMPGGITRAGVGGAIPAQTFIIITGIIEIGEGTVTDG